MIKVKLILFIFKKGVIWRYIEELAFHYKIKKGRLAENIVDKGSAKPQHSIKSAARPPYLYTIIYLYYTVAKLLQKSEMRKDIVIELSYKGFS